MRILHTSDWHIGRRFERESLEEDQRAFLAWLAEVVAEERVDLVLVAGDVYDRSQPAEDAVALLDDGLDGLRAAGARIVLVPGNHDSARRLGFGAARQALGGVHVFADDQHPPTPWVVTCGTERVAILAVPFLDPYGVPAPRPADDGSARSRTHEHVLADALESGRALLDLIAADTADVAVGRRPAKARWSEHVFAFYTRLRFAVPDPLCGMKAYRSELVRRHRSALDGTTIGAGLMVASLASGARLAIVPIPIRRRPGTSRFGSGFRANRRILAGLRATILIDLRTRRSRS